MVYRGGKGRGGTRGLGVLQALKRGCGGGCMRVVVQGDPLEGGACWDDN